MSNLINPLIPIDTFSGISPSISCWGDSLTNGVGGTSFPTFLSWNYKRLVNNLGIGGQTMQQIAARHGSVPIYITVAGNAFNNNTAISISSINIQFLSTPADNNSRVMSGTVCGVQCVILRTATGGPPSTSEVYTIQPVGNSTQAIPAGSQFFPDDGLNTYHDIQIFWWGRNNVPVLTGLDTTIDTAIGKIVRPRRVIIIGLKNAQNETNGTANKLAIDAMNSTLFANYPNNYIQCSPIPGSNIPVITQAEATAVGYGNFTTQDNTDIANGIFPASFHYDNVHLNSYGYQVIANRCIAMIGTFGW